MNASERTDISNVLKAQAVFERFRNNMLDDQDKAGAVQSFKFSYELCWRLMKRILESQGYEVTSPKYTFRKAALGQLIDDPEVWFEFQKKRNLTVHTYKEENLEEVISIFDTFSIEMNKFIGRVKVLLSIQAGNNE